MDMDRLLKSVKQHEGYRNKVYRDSLNKRTVGVGHLCVEDFWEDDKEYGEKFLLTILEHDLKSAIKSAERLCSDCPDLDDLAKETIVEMVFQLGKTGVSKFRNMWKALRNDPPNYEKASIEMLDSRWADQTPKRAKEMSDHMRSLA
jgi:lysozyme